jgi:hypothetical protein
MVAFSQRTFAGIQTVYVVIPLEIGHFLRSAAARRPLLHLESPVRASEGSPGQARAGAWDRCPPSRRPGSAFRPILRLSPRIARLWAIRGERSGEGGHLLPSGKSRVSLFSKHFSARSVILANDGGLPPHPSPLPQGYRLTPRWGSIGKKRPPAASQISNLEIPAKAGIQPDFQLATGFPLSRE